MTTAVARVLWAVGAAASAAATASHCRWPWWRKAPPVPNKDTATWGWGILRKNVAVVMAAAAAAAAAVKMALWWNRSFLFVFCFFVVFNSRRRCRRRSRRIYNSYGQNGHTSPTTTTTLDSISARSRVMVCFSTQEYGDKQPKYLQDCYTTTNSYQNIHMFADPFLHLIFATLGVIILHHFNTTWLIFIFRIQGIVVSKFAARSGQFHSSVVIFVPSAVQIILGTHDTTAFTLHLYNIPCARADLVVGGVVFGPHECLQVNSHFLLKQLLLVESGQDSSCKFASHDAQKEEEVKSKKTSAFSDRPTASAKSNQEDKYSKGN